MALVQGYTSQQEFIATQGPLKKTIEDFWRLVWEQNVCNIIMLTVCMENGRVGVHHHTQPSDKTCTGPFLSRSQGEVGESSAKLPVRGATPCFLQQICPSSPHTWRCYVTLLGRLSLTVTLSYLCPRSSVIITGHPNPPRSPTGRCGSTCWRRAARTSGPCVSSSCGT